MKAGTLSLNINTDDLNYGAMLHSWAFQQVLNKNNIIEYAEIIDYTTEMLTDFDCNHPVVSYFKQRRLKSAIKLILSGSSYRKRLKKFKKFQKKHMRVSEKKYTHYSLESAELPYDCLICESDVIWSPKFFNNKMDSAFFLDMKSMENKKKIIYSASMANADFDKDSIKQFKMHISAPDFISCRESYAVDIVNKKTARKAVHVLDPVLLLHANDYNKICAKPLIKEPYLLLYIPLGYNSDYQKTAIKYAKEHNMKVIELSYFTWNRLNHTVIADAGIEDFVSLIRNASVVFTNSFHAVCFSMIFHVDFYAFYRKTGKKTEDLCRTFDIMERYMDINDFSEKKPLDYSKIEKKLEEKRKDSINWLNNALEAK